jgi:hypothetical protein
MGRKAKKLSEMQQRTGRGGKKMYLYGGRWCSAEAIERMRRSRRSRDAKRTRETRAQARRERAERRDALTARRVDAVVAGVRDGETMDDIAASLGISRQWLFDLLREAPPSVRRRVEQARKAREKELLRRFKRYVAAGLSVAEMASDAGETRDVIRHQLLTLREKYPDEAPTFGEIARAHERAQAAALGNLMRRYGDYAAMARELGLATVTVTQKYSRLRQRWPALMPGLREAQSALRRR